jgi:hypothetical protein
MAQTALSVLLPDVPTIVAALDGQRVPHDRRPWVAHVLGVHCASGERWVQIAMAGRDVSHVVLRMTAESSLACARAALEIASDTLAKQPRIIEVRRRHHQIH